MPQQAPVAMDSGEVLRGRTDAELLAWIDSMGGSAGFLEQAFTGMREAFDADQAGDQSAIVQWNIETADGVIGYHLVVAEGRCDTRLGTHAEARVTLTVALPTFLRLLMGIMAGRDALAAGKLSISGDRAFASTFNHWFAGPN